jgi:hypothetical protein
LRSGRAIKCVWTSTTAVENGRTTWSHW